MPLVRVQKNGKVGWRYGNSGKVYFGKQGKKKALRQMKAMQSNYEGGYERTDNTKED